MLQDLYSYGLANNTDVALLDSKPASRKLYEKLGYKFLCEINHPLYGISDKLRLNLKEVEYLKSINSPFLQKYPKVDDV